MKTAIGMVQKRKFLIIEIAVVINRELSGSEIYELVGAVEEFASRVSILSFKRIVSDVLSSFGYDYKIVATHFELFGKWFF